MRSLIILIMLLTLTLLTGCGEVLNEYYISNYSDTNLTVRLIPRYLDTIDIVSGPLIEDIRESARSSLEQSVPFDQDGEVIQFEIPARTTIYLGISSGGNELFSQLEVRSDNHYLVMDDGDYLEYFTVHDRFVGAIVHVLNVK